MILTFYSYKGGTGRTMALANVACLLARSATDTSKRPVLMIDWDLEAPGLHRYFPQTASVPSGFDGGVVEYFLDLQDRLRRAASTPLRERECPTFDRFVVHDVSPTHPGLDLMPAGRFDSEYGERMRSVDWRALVTDPRQPLAKLREELAAAYSYVLIDSRTGLSDTSSVCTAVMPERLALVFTPNEQSLSGVLAVGAEAVRFRTAGTDLRSLAVYPVPARMDTSEKELRDQWRRKYETAFTDWFRTAYGDQDLSLSSYFDDVQIPHVPYFTYGERIAVVLEERSDALSMRRSYEVLRDRLVGVEMPWEGAPSSARRELKSPGSTAARAMGPSCFLSYASADRRFAKEIELRLREFGIRSSDASKIPAGEDWSEWVLSSLRGSACVVALFGAAGGEGRNAEVQAALESGVPVVPVLVPGAAPEMLPPPVRRLKFVDLREGIRSQGALMELESSVSHHFRTSRDDGAAEPRGACDVLVLVESEWLAEPFRQSLDGPRRSRLPNMTGATEGWIRGAGRRMRAIVSSVPSQTNRILSTVRAQVRLVRPRVVAVLAGGVARSSPNGPCVLVPTDIYAYEPLGEHLVPTDVGTALAASVESAVIEAASRIDVSRLLPFTGDEPEMPDDVEGVDWSPVVHFGPILSMSVSDRSALVSAEREIPGLVAVDRVTASIAEALRDEPSVRFVPCVAVTETWGDDLSNDGWASSLVSGFLRELLALLGP